jgi:hypothetical protein
MYGLNIDPLNPQGNPAGSELRDLGVGLVRWTFKDELAGGQPDPERVNFYTQKLREYKDFGISSLIIVSYETYPGKPGYEAPDQEWHAYLNSYLNRVSQLAGLLKDYHPAFQIWNEPDLAEVSPAYDPRLKEARYGEMLAQAHPRIKAVDPTLPVVGAGLASGDPAWWGRVVESQPGTPLLDVNCFHPYGQRPTPDWPDPNWGFGYVGDLINGYRAHFKGPWWISEIGVSTLTGEAAAEYLERFYLTIETKYSASVEWTVWFCYSDGMVNPYGLIDGAGFRKPIYGVYRDMASRNI